MTWSTWQDSLRPTAAHLGTLTPGVALALGLVWDTSHLYDTWAVCKAGPCYYRQLTTSMPKESPLAGSCTSPALPRDSRSHLHLLVSSIVPKTPMVLQNNGHAQLSHLLAF